MTLRLGIVVGELSGDYLAARLVQALRSIYPELTVEGILGPRLLEAGGVSLYRMDRLSVIGLIEPLGRLPELFQIRRKLIQHFVRNPPDLFIGVDAPDFNLGVEKKLKRHGIKTVHYVSPSVWAWRQGRIRTIQKAVDLMLTLFPFEAQFYQRHHVPVCFTGHPMADEIALKIDSRSARLALGLSINHPVIALLPGSRRREIDSLSSIFLLTARICYEKNKHLQFVIPVTSQEHKLYLENLARTLVKDLPIKIVINDSRTAISASDVALVKSGTATLEVMLHKKPMVVAYRVHPISFQIAKRLIKVPYISLPNLLANAPLVPEYLQDSVTPAILSQALLQYLEPSDSIENLKQQFLDLHLALQQNASSVASNAVVQLLQQ